MSNGNNIYNILGKLKNITDTEASTPDLPAETVYESVEPRGSITEAVKSLEAKFATFKEAKAKPDFLDVDKDGNKKEPFKKAVKDKEAVNEVFSDEEAKAQRDATKDRAWKAKGEANTKKYEKNKKAAEKRAQERAAKKAKQVSEGVDDLTDLDAYQFADPDKDVSVSPAQAKKDAAEKRRRLQDIEDRKAEKDDWFSGNDKESNVRIHKAKYQDDAEELDEETSATGGEITKKGNVTTHKAKKYGGEEEHTNNSGNSKDIMDRKSHKRVVDVGDPEDYDLDEVAPPGAKAERMVKHIKKGYADDGKLTKKEKGIAYATAWKAHNKGQVEEGVQFGDTVKNSKAEMKKAKPAMVKESRVMEETDYFYEKVGKALAEKNPTLDTSSGDFRTAVRKEMVAQGIDVNRARNILSMDEDFLSDVATSYAHCCKELAECGVPVNSHLGGVEELDEIAALAGIASPTKSQAKGIEQSVDTMDESADDEHKLERYHELIKQGMDPDDAEVEVFNDEGDEELAEREQFQSMPKTTAPTPAAPAAKPGVSYDKSKLNPMAEEEVEEGNEFSGALAKAKASGAKEFEVDGKRYTVKEDINVNITASGEEDALNLFRKLAGMREVEAQPALRNVNPVMDAESAIAQGIIEPVEEERDIEYINTPNEKIGPVSSAIPSGSDLNRSKEQDPKTANRAANPLTVKEDSLWTKYSTMLKGLIK